MNDGAHNTPSQGLAGEEELLNLLTTSLGPHPAYLPGHLGLQVLSVPKKLEVSEMTATSTHAYLGVNHNLQDV